MVDTAIVGAMVLLYALLFGWLSLERYWGYGMHALDMGNMGQAAWNMIHGHLFDFTNMRLPYHGIEAWGTTTRLSFHVEPLFPVISLVYLLYPQPESLLVLQTIALALGAVPVYLLARDVLQSRALAHVFTLAYLLFPTLEALNLYEFHPVSLATPLLLFAFLFAYRRQYLPFALCCLAAMGTKEEIGLVVAMFGLYVALAQRNWRVGAATVFLGVAWSLFAVLVVEHHFRQPGTKTYFNARYSYLGHGVRGILHTVLHDPGVFPRVLFTWSKLGYLERLLTPTGFVALLALPALFLGAPTFGLNLFSQDPHMYSALGDNSAELVSVVLIASILGARVILNFLELWLSRERAHLALFLYILVVALWNQRANGFTLFGAAFQGPAVGAHQKLADRFVSMIPSNAPVSTQDQLDPHLSSRRYLYLFEDTGRRMGTLPGLAPANYILLDASAPTYPLPSYQLYDRIRPWIRQPGWGISAADDGLILVKKGGLAKTPPQQFYTYLWATGAPPEHHLNAQSGGLRLFGYDVAHTDLVNHIVPNLTYTFYLRPVRPLRQNLQPVLFEVMGKHLIQCASDALGLAWFPTTRWSVGHAYRVSLGPMETTWQTPGTASLYAGLLPTGEVEQIMTDSRRPGCATLWANRGQVWPAGHLNIQF